jgi:hypothetical protein
MEKETIACTQVEIEPHRWRIVVRITLPDGTVDERVIADPDSSGLVIYDSVAEYDEAVS